MPKIWPTIFLTHIFFRPTIFLIQFFLTQILFNFNSWTIVFLFLKSIPGERGKIEASAFLMVGRYRYDCLWNINPSHSQPQQQVKPSSVTEEDRELVRSQATEPGFPCQHRSIPVYMEVSKLRTMWWRKRWSKQSKARRSILIQRTMMTNMQTNCLGKRTHLTF